MNSIINQIMEPGTPGIVTAYILKGTLGIMTAYILKNSITLRIRLIRYKVWAG
jgi:hypothetical protein